MTARHQPGVGSRPKRRSRAKHEHDYLRASFFWPQAWRDSACAGAVLKCTVAKRRRTAPAITLNLVSCVFTTPHHQAARERARIPKIARSPRKPSAAISNPRQLGVARDLHPPTLEAPAPTRPRHRIRTFFNPSVSPCPCAQRLGITSTLTPPPRRSNASARSRARPSRPLTRFDDVSASVPTPPTLPAPPQPPSIVYALTRPSAAFVFRTLVFQAPYHNSSPSRPRIRATTRSNNSLRHLDMRHT